MRHHLLFAAVVFVLFLQSTAYCGESTDNRSGKTWSFEGATAYRSADVREYALGVTHFDDLTTARGGTSLALGRLFTGQANFGASNDWKLDGHSLTVSYRKFIGNSFFVESGLQAETFRAWQPNLGRYPGVDETLDFGHAQRLAMTVQCGNQWQWEHLNFGISWLGAIIPLAHKADDDSEQDASFRSYLTTVSNLGVRFSIGWAL